MGKITVAWQNFDGILLISDSKVSFQGDLWENKAASHLESCAMN